MDKFNFLVSEKNNRLELILNDFEEEVKSPVLSYSGGFFYFFNKGTNFESFVTEVSNKPFYDTNSRMVLRELVGNYCCDVECCELGNFEYKLALSKGKNCAVNYDSLTELLKNSLSVTGDNILEFNKIDGVDLSKVNC